MYQRYNKCIKNKTQSPKYQVSRRETVDVNSRSLVVRRNLEDVCIILVIINDTSEIPGVRRLPIRLSGRVTSRGSLEGLGRSLVVWCLK